jgi:asparagine synthase (glutamine-hydrolysing)
MCGIFGVFFGTNLDIPAVIKSSQHLKHRGRDGVEHCIGRDNDFIISHYRHIVIDAFHGTQPFYYGDMAGERVIWVMNSEVYNHTSIKEEVDPQHYIETCSDSAAIGYLYKQFGED